MRAGLPPELYTILEAYPWRFGEPYCLFKTFLTEMTSSASILTIAAFTVERYLAICHSLRAHATSGLSRAVRVVVVVWVAACLTAVPYPIHTRTYYYLQHPVTGRPLQDSLICTIPVHWMPNMRYAFQVSKIPPHICEYIDEYAPNSCSVYSVPDVILSHSSQARSDESRLLSGYISALM